MSPKSENKYTIQKTVCTECDSTLIKKLWIDAINIAKEKKGLKTMHTVYGETGVNYTLPILFELPRKKNKDALYYQP